MGHTFTRLLYHVVFATRLRLPLLATELRKPLSSYWRGVVKARGGQLIVAGGTEDHVHLLLAALPRESLSTLVKWIKGSSSRWVNEHWTARTRFGWQRGYSAFTVSHSALARVQAYIERQREHHERVGFQRELAWLLKAHGLTGPDDERSGLAQGSISSRRDDTL